MTGILGFVPTYKNQLTGTTLLTTHALASALRSRGIEWGISCISNPDVEWVRNWAITHWYDCLPRYNYLLFIDDDQGFMPDVVLDMIAFGEPVVGALYPKKTADRQWAVSGLPNPEVRGPFMEVEGLGCGCFLIRRDAITTMLEKMPELSDTRPNTIESQLFRDAGVKRLIRPFDCINDMAHGKVSEDISFGRRWRECGGKVWAATHHKIVHVGPHEYVDCYATWAKAEQEKRSKDLNDKITGAPILKENPVLRGKACKHGLFVYNPNDTFIGKSLECYGEWSEFEIDILRQFIKEGDTVFDVGANIGTHTVAFSRMVGKTGQVFAFEAQPRLEKILAANIELNNCGNVVWDLRAIGPADGKLTLSPLPSDDTAFNFGTGSAGVGGADVDMLAIDTFAAEMSPSVIKIDVEGMELDVIRGARQTIERCKPVLYFDVGDDGGLDGDEIDALLREIGYIAYWSVGAYFNPNNIFKNLRNAWPNQNVWAANLVAIPLTAEKELVNVVRDLHLYLGPGDTLRQVVERMAARQAAE